MQTCLPIFLFIFILPNGLNAQRIQCDDSNWQDSIIAKMGIDRRLKEEVNSGSAARESQRFKTTHTFFDSLGRIIKIIKDDCYLCGTIMKYDSGSRLESYKRIEWKTGVQEIYTKYDAKKRRIASDICTNKECASFIFEYDADNTERMYKIIDGKYLKLDTAKDSDHFFWLYNVPEEEKQLIQEDFFSPEGQLEETKYYKNGRFQKSTIYEYNAHGKVARIWNLEGKIKQISHESERNKFNQLVSWKTYVLSTIDPLHTLGQPSIKRYEYYDNGLLKRTTIGSTVSEYSYFTD